MLDAILHHRGALAYSKTDLPALQETARQLQGYAKAERHTLGRMLHDGPMQSLALALVKLSTLPAEDIADATQALLQEALGALQLLENELYSPAVDLLSLGGGASAAVARFAPNAPCAPPEHGRGGRPGRLRQGSFLPPLFPSGHPGAACCPTPRGRAYGRALPREKGLCGAFALLLLRCRHPSHAP